MSISTLLARRGSPGATRNLDEQPALCIPITPVEFPIVASVKFRPPEVEPVWQPAHLLSKIACMLLATVLFALATPNTVEASVAPAEDFIVTVTNPSVGADEIVKLVVMTVADVTDAGVTVYPPPRLSITVTVIPLAKFVPAIDSAWGTEDATIPTGTILLIVDVVLPVVVVVLPPPPPPPQDMSPNVSTARPHIRPTLNT